jgi:glycosyltransferase involved in cell wall biosynthesis
MRIGLLSYEYPPETGFGGIGTYTWYQARALSKLGHEVHVIAGATAPAALRRDDHDGVKVHRHRWSGPMRRALAPLGRPRLFWTRNRIENGLTMYLGLRELRRRLDFDVLEMPECGAEGLIVNHLTRIPTVVKFHSPAQLIMGDYDVTRADHVLCGIVERVAFRGALGYTAGSRFLAQEVKGRLGVRRPVTVIPNGIDLELFDAAEELDARARFGLSRDRLMIFFSGRMERRKGVHLVKDIAASVLTRPDVELVLAGDDLFGYAERELLPSLGSKSLRGSVRFLGKLDARSLRSCLRQTDIFLLPSLWENCPYACLEAMAAGRAIVSSDAGGLPELIENGRNGLLARNREVLSYVKQIEALIEDRALRERLGLAARRTVVERFTDVRVAEATLAYYRGCMEAKA